MCGIVAAAGRDNVVPLLLEGLRRLEYRGYDSCGIAVASGDGLRRVRSVSRVAELAEQVLHEGLSAATGIAHTRWATHGAPEVCNAHPHFSGDLIGLVHNGIIENFETVRAKLVEKGYVFTSQTDTEAVAHLIHSYYDGDLLEAVQRAVRDLRGTYGLAVICKQEPGRVVLARQGSPLVVGVADTGMYAASDAMAIAGVTDRIIYLAEGDVCALTNEGCRIYERTAEGFAEVEREVKIVHAYAGAVDLGPYRHYMQKEIFEQPRVITDGLSGRVQDGKVCLPELDGLPVPERLHIVACGTSYHSGLWGRHLLENWAHIPVQVEIASEFRYRESLLPGKGDMVLVISQSGETADTLAALRIAREKGVPVLGLCNVVGSSIAREASAVILTQAGPEISVASTKAMCSQMLMLALMALYWGQRNDGDAAERARCLSLLESLPVLLGEALPAMHERARELSRKYAQARNFFYLGRGHCFPLALEGALKLKELSYIHAEGYAAGEMKHGPIALIDPAFPSLVLALDDELYPKVVSNMVEVKARQGKVIALCNPGREPDADDIWRIPALPAPLAGFMALPALQLFSYEMADYLGKDVDQPRNLAKSVTVE